jgi:hypothetical protein
MPAGEPVVELSLLVVEIDPVQDERDHGGHAKIEHGVHAAGQRLEAERALAEQVDPIHSTSTCTVRNHQS